MKTTTMDVRMTLRCGASALALAVLVVVVLPAVVGAAPAWRMPSDVEAGSIQVNTTDGKVRGFVANKTRIWRGIPYATPPVGSRRWASPSRHTPWSHVKSTTVFGPACPQVP